MKNQVTLSLGDSFKKLQKELNDIPTQLEAAVQEAIKDAAQAAYASIISKAQSELGHLRQDYLKGLKFEDLGDNNFLISLDGKLPNEIEDGYGAYDLRAGMLASNKNVSSGTRAGQPWVQQSAPDGPSGQSHKYAHVPISVGAIKKASQTSNMADAIKKLTATNAQGLDQKLTKIFTGEGGLPLQGKVAVASSSDPRLDGLVKYQNVKTDQNGKQTVHSLYVNYRTVSEKGDAWIHPGRSGLKAFDEAEKELADHLDEIVRYLSK